MSRFIKSILVLVVLFTPTLAQNVKETKPTKVNWRPAQACVGPFCPAPTLPRTPFVPSARNAPEQAGYFLVISADVGEWKAKGLAVPVGVVTIGGKKHYVYATARHIISDGKPLELRLNGSNTSRVTTDYSVVPHPYFDLSLLVCDDVRVDERFIHKLRDSDPRTGEVVYAGRGVDRRSAHRGTFLGRTPTGLLKHTAVLVDGMSGGPLVDQNGNLLGINVSQMGRSYLSVPVSAVRELLNLLKQTGQTPPTNTVPEDPKQPESPEQPKEPDLNTGGEDVAEKLKEIESKLNALESKVGGIEKAASGLVDVMTQFNERINKLENLVNNLPQDSPDVSSLKQEVAALRAEVQKLYEMETEIRVVLPVNGKDRVISRGKFRVGDTIVLRIVPQSP